MLITKKSPLSGKTHTLELPITEEQLASWTLGRLLIQEAFPHLSADQREFILSGITPEEWEAAFPEE